MHSVEPLDCSATSSLDLLDRRTLMQGFLVGTCMLGGGRAVDTYAAPRKSGELANAADQKSLERILDGRAWDDFCESLKGARAALFREHSPSNAFDRAEGYRYLTRLLRVALECFVENADPEHPRFYQMARADAKLGADNPDCNYRNCVLDGNREYRIRGRRGTSTYLGIGTYYGHYGDPGPSGGSGYLDSADLALDSDGRFEIVLSAKPHPGN